MECIRRTMTWVAGVDGCSAGWFVVLKDTGSGETRHRAVGQFADLLRLPEHPVVIGIDIPIGLLDRAIRGGRECDRAARSLLGQPRARSVFSPPVRVALRHADYASANKANRASSPDKIGISIQSFGLRTKLLEVDRAMTPKLQGIIKEIHPELSFYELNTGRAVERSKKEPEGLSHRSKLLLSVGFDGVISGINEYPRVQVGEDDILDACAASWTAARILEGRAVRVPDNAPCDMRGLRMEIWR